MMRDERTLRRMIVLHESCALRLEREIEKKGRYTASERTRMMARLIHHTERMDAYAWVLGRDECDDVENRSIARDPLLV